MKTITVFYQAVLTGITAALLIFSPLVQAQVLPGKKLTVPASIPKASKVTADLSHVAEEYKEHLSKPNARQKPFAPSNPYIQLRQDRYVVIDAVAENDARALQKDLEAMGAIGVVAFGRVVSAQIPVERVAGLKALASLRFVHPAYKPRTNVGFVETQGDKAQRSDLARAQFKVNGKGIKVGVLSDSYNNLTGERLGILTGDLPGLENPNGFTDPVDVLSDLDGGGADEGRAMMEIIHDVAPGAKMAFHTAFNGQADYALGILRLQQAGCQVIVDDVLYSDEPYFQDGIISQAIDQVAQKGVTYFSFAGNYGRSSYEKAFQPSGIRLVEGEAHDFGNGNPFSDFVLPAGGEAVFVLQWSDPFFSVSGGKGAATDLDFYVVNQSSGEIVRGSRFANIGNDPVEGFSILNEGPETVFSLVVENVQGPNPDRIKIIGFGISPPPNREGFTYSSTVSHHANAKGAIAVGAARYDQTPAFGVDKPVIEWFSSAGGTPILFDELGNRISPIIRQKPEMTAPDGANTTFFFPGDDLEGDGFPNFFGTSASAPHAAAVAALLLEATGHKLTPTQIRDVLQETAVDMDDPFTPDFDAGFDFGTGYGLIQADKAIQRATQAQSVQRFILVNAHNGQHLQEIHEGDLINLAALPTHNLNIVAITEPRQVGSVVFTFNGKHVTENLLPYALGGDYVTTPYQYNALEPAVQPGEYSLSATPYTARGGAGKAGLSLAIHFRVVPSAVERFTLVDAATHRDLFEITDQSLIDLAQLPGTQLNIRADTRLQRVGSVVFEYSWRSFTPPYATDGIRAVENTPPYALGGDLVTSPFQYRPLADTLLQQGDYVLKATSYAGKQGTGTAGATRLVRFTLVNSAEALPDALAENDSQTSAAAGKHGNVVSISPSASTDLPEVEVFPNPSKGTFTIKGKRNAKFTLYNAQGSIIHHGETEEQGTAALNISGQPSGFYLLVVNDGLAPRSICLIKQ